ncbi:Platelet glycoprotein Ib alpha chain [Channa argus]|uniref:Platelet glycoprotein Ib alpha chain n=1 Tax=Channa argus TaxID=215402 RepID=A0A6G1Q7S0_CHAAH|nr:Platelet glycoprotein Ib alpha chain [Channa argus]
MQLFLLLVVILSHFAIVTAVDGCHRDRDKDHRPRENCTSAGLTSVPGGFEPTTKVFLFPRNLFTSLSWTSFQTFTKIYEIDLTGNKVPKVTPSATPILPTLSVLRLGSNSLKSLSDSSFSACPGLTELYLENNIIRSLSDHTFSGLSKLEILDLSSNHISVLPTLMLHPLKSIETLYLEENKIKVMPDDWFSQKMEVPYLYLSANPWACSCSLDYLHKYLNDYELNFYVRDGIIINSNSESLVCDSPQQLRSKPIITLEESELCDADAPTATEFTNPTAIPFDSAITTPDTDVATVVYHRVVTWSWYQTFTSFSEWSYHSRSAARGDGSEVRSHASGTTVPTTTEIPTSYLMISTTTKPLTTTSAILPLFATEATTEAITEATTEAITEATTEAITEATTEAITEATTEATTEAITEATTEATTEPTTEAITEATTEATAEATTEAITVLIHSLVKDKPFDGDSGQIRAVRAADVFCFWLFAGCLMLCVASFTCTLITVARIVIWYRRVYKPLSAKLVGRRKGGREAVSLLNVNRLTGGGGVVALYRSVLYVHRVGGEAGEKEGEQGEEGGNERVLVSLEPTTAGGGAAKEEEGERGGSEERPLYRKMLYRLLSKEEEIEGWRDVMEECRISEEDGGKREVGKDGGIGGGEVSRKRYSVILREEREETGGGREELDWVVGGWEVKRRGAEGERQDEEQRSSWGEWLAHYLPSMPWGVTTPPEAEAAL